MSVLFAEGVKDNALLKTKLLNHVRAKNITAEYIWYLLTGWLVTSSSYNYLINSRCELSVNEKMKRDNNYKKDQEEKTKNTIPSRTYTTYD